MFLNFKLQTVNDIKRFKIFKRYSYSIFSNKRVINLRYILTFNPTKNIGTVIEHLLYF